MKLVKVPILPKAAETSWGTVLFADLRGYVSLAERLTPARVVPLLEEFFAVLASAIELHAGQIYHVAGDGMMAGFGFNASAQDGAFQAYAASRAMLQQFKPLATRWQRELAIDTGMGIGLHYGEAALGLFGPPGNRATTLVGDTVNVAARLCNRARVGEVLFSASVAAKLGAAGRNITGPPLAGSKPFLLLPKFSLRGRGAPVDIWCVPASQRGANLAGAQLH